MYNNDVVEKIKNMFIKEAAESPVLFNDLANLEKYVSESYSGRSLIELLQNADDASATRFLLQRIDSNVFLVANDGRPFTDEDLFSLCRSGASTKKRKGNTIGYRGIGFKSVVNYAENVYLYSGTIKTVFSKKLTYETLQSEQEVPLIRIPHQFDSTPYDELIDRILSQGYNTVFVFETRNNMWQQEAVSFDASCMLFLNSVCDIRLDDDESRSFSTERVLFENGTKVFLNENKEHTEWLVVKSDLTSSKSGVAFKLNDDKIVPADPQESIVHSFMPTLTRLSMPIKINGDFSTDPSRTRVTVDADSQDAIKDCVNILGNFLKQVVLDENDRLGLVKVVGMGKIDPLHKIRGEDVNDIFCRLLKEFVLDFLNDKTNSQQIYLQPNGMDDDDFLSIINYHGAYGISAEQNEKIPGLFDLLRSYNIPYLPSTLSVDAMKTITCADTTKVTVVSALIEENKLGISEELKQDIKDSQIFKFTSGESTINNATSEVVLDDEFEGSVLETVSSPREFETFTKKLGIKISDKKASHSEEHQFTAKGDVEIQSCKIETAPKAIKKWRSVEMNVAEVLKLSENVSSVKDVSKQNVGYDLEATMQDGTKRFYEVKSVDGFSDSFSITNNEYSTANTNKENYYLAIANATENSLEVCFIKNPIDSLKFIKRVTRWEWLCEEYSGETIKVKMNDKTK